MESLNPFEKIRKAVMTAWLGMVLPEHASRQSSPAASPFANPLVHHVRGEFDKLFDYMFSLDLTCGAPVAETLVKFKALGATSTRDVIGYAVMLKQCILNALKDVGGYENLTPFQSSMLDQKTAELAAAASGFYELVRATIEKIKNDEIAAGTFSTESLGMTGAVCPSAVMEHSQENRL